MERIQDIRGAVEAFCAHIERVEGAEEYHPGDALYVEED